MITYSLACAKDHVFEGWFQNSAAFDAQAAAGEVLCPVCGDTEVRKGVMAPSVKGSATKSKGGPTAAERHKVRQFLAGYRKFVVENAENVGRRFPEEARKIHYGESEERPIYGEATTKEVVDLVDEGVRIAPLPLDPDALN